MARHIKTHSQKVTERLEKAGRGKASCPVCKGAINEDDVDYVSQPKTGDYKRFSCLKCGRFELTGSAAAIAESNEWLAKDSTDLGVVKASVGAWIREQARFSNKVQVNSYVLEELISAPQFPPVAKQLENVMLLVGDLVGEPGPVFYLSASLHQYRVGCRTPEGVNGLVNHLIQQGVLTLKKTEKTLAEYDRMNVALTVSGWLRYEDIKRGKTSGRTAFMAMPFNRDDLDEVWLPRLRSAVKETGFDLQRVDDNPKAGLIDTEMRLQIKAARFLLVELTHSNLGAYWEAGYAEGLGKPVIYLRRNDEGGTAHFDVEHSLRVPWDADDMEPALRMLKATIRNTVSDAVMD